MKTNQHVYVDMNAPTERSLYHGAMSCYACKRTFVL